MTNEESKEIIIKERDSLKANPIVQVEDCLYEAFDVAIKALEQQPKVGKWIKTSLSQVSGGDFNRGFKCSCCGYVTVVDDFNYCPNCGARMTESEE